MRTNLITALFILMLPLFCNGQNDQGSESATGFVEQGQRKTNNRQYKNLIKINPTLFLSGNMPIYWERHIKGKAAIELSAGLTTKDIFFEAFYFPELPNGFEEVDARKYLLGYSGSVSLKFYPSDDKNAMEGFYFAPEVRYRAYRSSALVCGAPVNSPFAIDYVAETRKYIDAKIVFGYVEHLGENIFLEGYTGVGIRNRDITRAYCNSSDTEILNTKGEAKAIFSLGFKFGFAF